MTPWEMTNFLPVNLMQCHCSTAFQQHGQLHSVVKKKVLWESGDFPSTHKMSGVYSVA
uniref:Uncharacterized protein n=1 Tax=Anguilla anguilla TaxID=7936 RepID=A0A0E9W8A9_ANGAN